jgi:catechol 2,3-dioxygenase
VECGIRNSARPFLIPHLQFLDFATSPKPVHPAARIGAVHLTISDLGRSIAFYESRIGFSVVRRAERTAVLGAGGAELLVLSQCETAPRVRGTTGLYHFAILVPSRADLAQSLRRVVETQTVLQGAADHGVSEALYLADPDGNGIEIYRDRARAEWPIVAGHLRMTADPLDFDGLLGEDAGGASASLAAGTVIGHVHLHVSRLDEAERFYVGVLGFDLMQRYGPGALFVSAGGYHHHIGLNTWTGVGAPPPPPGAIGLKHFEIVVPNHAALDAIDERLRVAGVEARRERTSIEVHDSSSNAIHFALVTPS